jgi:hypothetical protein
MDQNHLLIINQQHDDNNRYFISKFWCVLKAKLYFYFCICFFFFTVCVCFSFILETILFFLFICLKLIVKIRHCDFLIYVYMNCSLIVRKDLGNQCCLLVLSEQIIIKFFISIVYYYIVVASQNKEKNILFCVVLLLWLRRFCIGFSS